MCPATVDSRHHQHGRWEARIGRVLGNKYLVRYKLVLETPLAFDFFCFIGQQ